MQDDDGDVVFLDDDELGDESWLEDERIESGRDPSRLPPHAAPRRVLVTLVALAVFLSGVGTAFGTAYHRHETDRQLANELVLAPTSSPPQITGLVELGNAPEWHAHVTKQIVIPVVNRSPRPITLLGAALKEPGLVGDTTLTPRGTTSLKPGQTGTLTGKATVDCTQSQTADFPGVDTSSGAEIPVADNSALVVRAQTSGGSLASVTVNPDARQGDVQARICDQESGAILGATGMTSSWNAATHTAVVTMIAPSQADIPLQYEAVFSLAYDGPIPSGGCDAGSTRPLTTTGGEVRPGETTTVSYAIQMTDCSASHRPSSTEDANVTVSLSANGTPLASSMLSIQLDSVLPEA